ncbi:hypothetical protein ABZ473_21355, partial [Streptomyces cellulosae]
EQTARRRYAAATSLLRKEVKHCHSVAVPELLRNSGQEFAPRIPEILAYREVGSRETGSPSKNEYYSNYLLESQSDC